MQLHELESLVSKDEINVVVEGPKGSGSKFKYDLKTGFFRLHSTLYKDATQTVFAEDPKNARIVLIGEQSGDREDLQGHPFVGPAGKFLDRCLGEGSLDRKATDENGKIPFL
jgi:hypothetical protein